MNKKEIYASIEVADHEVRLVVGEFYETRFNILRVEKAPIQGIEKQKIMDEQNVVNGIIKARSRLRMHLDITLSGFLRQSLPSTYSVITKR